MYFACFPSSKLNRIGKVVSSHLVHKIKKYNWLFNYGNILFTTILAIAAFVIVVIISTININIFWLLWIVFCSFKDIWSKLIYNWKFSCRILVHSSLILFFLMLSYVHWVFNIAKLCLYMKLKYCIKEWNFYS